MQFIACAGGYPELSLEVSDDVRGLVDGDGGEDVSEVGCSSNPVNGGLQGQAIGFRER